MSARQYRVGFPFGTMDSRVPSASASDKRTESFGSRGSARACERYGPDLNNKNRPLDRSCLNSVAFIRFDRDINHGPERPPIV